MNVNRNQLPKLPDRPKRFFMAEKALEPVSIPRLGNWRMWINLVLLFLALGVAVYSIQRAQWISPQPAFILVLFLSMLFTTLLVIVRLSGWIIPVLAIPLGLLVAAWQAAALLPGSPNIGHLLQIFQLWLQGATTLLPTEEKAVFASLIVFLVWFIGYLSTWFILRKNNAWVPVALGAMVIIVNLSNLPARYYFFFPVYFIACIFLVIQTRITRQYMLSGHGAGYTGKSLLYLFTSLICIIALASSVSWIIPQARASSLQDLISTKMTWRQNIRKSSINIFNAVPSKEAINTADLLRILPFDKNWNAGAAVSFTVKSERPSYWTMHVYDTYTPQGWTNSATTQDLLGANTIMNENGDNNVIRYEVTAGIKTDVLLITGNFLSSSSQVLVQTGPTGDTLEVAALHIFEPGDHYTVQASVSDLTAAQLEAAGQDYPQSVKDIYLQLPADFSDRVRALSENITTGAATPYDKVLAIVNYLAALPYESTVTAAPPGVDAVEYFLFDQKGGFCVYFASAMAVMLRSAGVPARVAVGFLPGDPGPERGTYLLKDNEYHAWPQVYFPGYGWVNFEATPGGGGGSQVPIKTPLVSTPAIRELPQWSVWDYPLQPPPAPNYNVPPATATATSKGGGWPDVFPFAAALGKVILIILAVVLIGGLLTLIVLAVRRAFQNQLWQVDREALAVTTYEKLCRLAALANITPDPRQTPLEFAAELKAALPDEAVAIDDIVRAYLENRFGNRKGKMGLYEEAQILKSRRAIYNRLLRWVGKRSWGLKYLTTGNP